MLKFHSLKVAQVAPDEAQAVQIAAVQIVRQTAADARPDQLARDVVLREMFQQGYLTRTVYEASRGQALPAGKDIQAPREQAVEGNCTTDYQ